MAKRKRAANSDGDGKPKKVQANICLMSKDQTADDANTTPLQKSYDNHLETEEPHIDLDDSGEQAISSYEQLRINHIHQNQEMLKKLNIFQTFSVSKQAKRFFKKTKPKSTLPRPVVAVRRSARQQSLPAKSLAESKLEAETLVATEEQRYEVIKLSSTLTLQEALCSDDIDLNSVCKEWSSFKVTPLRDKMDNGDSSVSGLLKRFKSFKLQDDDVRKIIPSRITSLSIHPTEEKVLVAAADKKGMLSIWDVDSTDEKNSIVLAEPHKMFLSCVKYIPGDNCRLLTSSYDGTMRCCDINKMSLDEIYSSPDDNSNAIHGFAFPHQSRETCLAAQYNGDVIIVDHREGGSSSTLNIEQHPLKYIDCHPTSSWLFVTCSSRDVSIWDRRKVSDCSSMISSVTFAKTPNSAPFSPDTGCKIAVASLNDRVTVYDVTEYGDIAQSACYSQHHNNFTGRWLTKLRVTWDPESSDNGFVIGSMMRPRQVDVYSANAGGGFVTNLRSNNLTSVSSVNAFHPTLPRLLVGANASGKVFVWR